MPILKDLTIAIITYRRPQLLRRCLNSIKQQSYHPKKIIIIDSHVQKTSIPQSRNLALKKCQTKYLAFVDDDCILNKNWVFYAYQSISVNQKLAFVVGKTNLLNNQNPIAKTQFKAYQEWFNNYHSLDTKNVILNYQKIKNLHFDTNFKIFEDIDFNQQLQSNNLIGTYNSRMQIYHPEVDNFFKALKKNYLRGQYKAKITSKWGNFDNFIPTLPIFTNFIDFVLKTAFVLGFLKHPPRPITIVNNQDKGANEQRLQVFYQYLKNHHCYVNTIDSQFEFEKVLSSKKYLLVYGFPLLKYRSLKFIHDRLNLNQNPRLLFQTLILRKAILHRLLIKNRTSLAIIQYPEDMLITSNQNRHYQTLYDSPTLYFRELELAKKFPKATIDTLKALESKVYLNSNFVSFHWYTYFALAKNYSFKINNPIRLNWGCQIQSKTAYFNSSPKIIHLGKLNAYWVNPNLLSSISQKTNLEVFSYEIPNKIFYPNSINFKGFIKKENAIANYQFGLITLSRDDLRSQGFSAKYLLYLSFGLPVLCPEWRQDKLLKSATIYYNEKNINQQIKKYSNKDLWLKKHHAALKISQSLNWNITLLLLLKKIDSLKIR